MNHNSDGQRWALHNPLRGWILEGLSRRELDLILATLTTAEAALTIVWHPGWTSWERINSENFLNEKTTTDVAFKMTPVPPTIPSQFVSESEHEITEVRPVQKVEKQVLPRLHIRYIAEADCDIIVGSHIFKTKTVDVSRGGLCFKDTLPDWVTGYFNVLIHANPPFELTCAMVEDQRRERIRAEVVDGMNRESLLKLEKWITESLFLAAPN